MIPSCPAPILEGEFSVDFKDFVSRCLEKEPEARPGPVELLQHKFIRENARDLNSTLGPIITQWRHMVPPSAFFFD